MSNVGYIWIPALSGTDTFNDIERYLRDCVPFDTFNEAMTEQESAYEHQERQFGTTGPMCIVKVIVEVVHDDSQYAGDSLDYSYFDGPYEEVSHG